MAPLPMDQALLAFGQVVSDLPRMPRWMESARDSCRVRAWRQGHVGRWHRYPWGDEVPDVDPLVLIDAPHAEAASPPIERALEPLVLERPGTLHYADGRWTSDGRWTKQMVDELVRAKCYVFTKMM